MWHLPPADDFYSGASFGAVSTLSVVPPRSTTELHSLRKQPPVPGSAPERIYDNLFIPEEHTGHSDWPLADAIGQLGTDQFGFTYDPTLFGYSVEIRVESNIGDLQGGYTACLVDPPDYGIGSAWTAWQDGWTTITPDLPLDMLEFDTGDDVTTATSDDAGAHLSAPSVNPGGEAGGIVLENPDPPYTIPDSFGNTSGRAVFTYDQIVALPTIGIDWAVYWVGKEPTNALDEFGNPLTYIPWVDVEGRSIDLLVTILRWAPQIETPTNWMCVL